MAKTQFLRMLHIPVHLVANYAIWFLCVISAANGWVSIGISISLVIIVAMVLWQVVVMDDVRYLLSWVLLITVLGSLVDLIVMHAGLIVFASNPWLFTPLWIIIVWMAFAVILFGLLRHYFQYHLFFSLCAGLGFFCAYYAGSWLGAASLPKGIWGPVTYGIVWAILLPICNWTYLNVIAKGKQV